MQDSRYSQLIQAADLTAYAAYQYLRVGGLHANNLRLPGNPSSWAAAAYRELEQQWVPMTGARDGIRWMNVAPSDDEAPDQ